MRRALGVAALTLVAACAPSADGARVARSTLVVGIDVSGSFEGKGNYESSVDFAANYLYGHLHGLGGLNQPTAVFVGSLGGEKPGEAKSFQPIHTFQNMTAPHVAAYLRYEYTSRYAVTDFHPIFQPDRTLAHLQNIE